MAALSPSILPTPENKVFEIYRETLEVGDYIDSSLSKLYQGHLSASNELNAALARYARNAYSSVMTLGDWRCMEAQFGAEGFRTGRHLRDDGYRHSDSIFVHGLELPEDVIITEKEYRSDELMNRLWKAAFSGNGVAKNKTRTQQDRYFYNKALESERNLGHVLNKFVIRNIGAIASFGRQTSYEETSEEDASPHVTEGDKKPVSRSGNGLLTFETEVPPNVLRAEQSLADTDLEWMIWQNINAHFANEQHRRAKEHLVGKKLRFSLLQPQNGTHGIFGYYDPNFSHGQGLAVYNYDIAPTIEGEFFCTNPKGVITISNPGAPTGYMSIISIDEKSKTPNVKMSISD